MPAKPFLILPILSVLALPACAQDNTAPVAIRQSAQISQEEQRQLEKAALAGDGKAAHRLGSYHQLFSPTGPDGAYWLAIAVENGTSDAMYSLGVALTDTRDEKSRTRGIYWLRRAMSESSSELAKYAAGRLKALGETP